MDTPNTQPGVWPASIRGDRFAAAIGRGLSPGPGIAIVGVPDDTGVEMNGGRPGAAGGPRGFREALAVYGSGTAVSPRAVSVVDAGDVQVVRGDLDTTHGRITAAVGAVLDAGRTPVVIGGGHDLTWAAVRALCERSSTPPAGVSFDAHLDVRETPGSGMSFRRLMDGLGVRSVTVHGLDPYANSAEHMAWFAAHGGRQGVRAPEDDWAEGEHFASLDLDVIDQAYAPGVSAMNPIGWAPALAERWCRSAGRCRGVRCFDIAELAPPLDVSGRTARLAARLFLAFVRGFSER